jgi:hypothetical protein
MKRQFFLFLVCCFISTSFLGQENINCGTEVSKKDHYIIQKFISDLKATKFTQTPLDSLVPIKLHIVGYSDSSNAIDSTSVLNEINVLNSYYYDAGIQFVHCGNINYVFNNEYALFEKINDESLCDTADIENVLNIYFVPRLYKISNSDTVNLCGYAYLSGVSKNRIIMKNSCATNGSTLAHEVGHYFSLYHTHSLSNGEELVNGSNCSTAGDSFCDTPADPTLSSATVTNSCTYIGNEQDVNGDFYEPDVTNFMSYSRKSCRDFFSLEQLTQMKAYLFLYRNYLFCPLDIDSSFVGEDFNFNFYPNPAKDLIHVHSNQIGVSLTLKIHDLTGRVMLDVSVNATFILAIDRYNYGVYFITLSNNNESITKKFIKAL